MKKVSIVINGAGGVGKDTLCDICSEHFKTFNISSITPIKEIASLCGWDGKKDDRARKFLSDMKRLMIEYNDYPTVWAKAKFDEFMESDNEVMFLHVREPEEIEKFVSITDRRAKTLLIRGGKRTRICAFGNSSDDCVENYNYDYYFVNDKPLSESGSDFVSLISNILKDCE